MNRLALLAPLLAACGAAATTAAPAPPAYSGPREIHKGDAFDAILRGGEDHVYTIALDGAEAVTFTVDGAAAQPCPNWAFAWHAPDGAWVTGNPLAIAPDGDGPRPSGPIDVRAEVAGGGEMVPVAGTWSFHVAAAVEDCTEMRYRITAE